MDTGDKLLVEASAYDTLEWMTLRLWPKNVLEVETFTVSIRQSTKKEYTAPRSSTSSNTNAKTAS